MARARERQRARLAAIAQHLPTFLDPATSVGEWYRPDAGPGGFSAASFAMRASAERFVEDCYVHGWVLGRFDWPAWAQSDEAQTLRDEPTALARASERQLGQLLTVVIRQDRFCEGTLAGAVATGLILGILRRAECLVAEADGTP